MPAEVSDSAAEPSCEHVVPEAQQEEHHHRHHHHLHHDHDHNHHHHHHPHHHHHHLRRKDASLPDLTKLDTRKSDLIQRSAISFVDVPQGNDSPTKSSPGRMKRYLTHMQKSRKRILSVSSYVPTKGVNLRDVGAVTRGPMKECAVFRSSELLSKEEMQTNQIKTILDLRRMDRPCKAEKGNGASESATTILKYLLWGPSKIIPEKRLIPAHRARPRPCQLCHEKAKRRYGSDINVIHADLIPSTVGLRIFQSMPWRVQLKTVFCAVTGQGAGSVMAPAVANNNLLGYKALYRTLLEDSKRGMAMAIRPFADAENYPILVHCIHGKDRTGLLIMLLLMLCNVPTEAIVEDYMMSETVLKESRLHKELHLDVYLTTDEVIAATRDNMEDTITYVNEKYGGAAEYFKECGLEKDEIEAISKNLMKEEDLAKADPLFKPRFSILESISSINPFKARSSTTGDGKDSRFAVNSSRLTRVSEAPSSIYKSTSLQSHPSIRSQLADGSEKKQAEHMRRASLSTMSAKEIQGRLAKLRAEHPELGPLSEEAPVDFLRASDASVRNGKVRNGTVSMDMDVAPLDSKKFFGRKLKKTVSCPVSPTSQKKLQKLSSLEPGSSDQAIQTVISAKEIEVPGVPALQQTPVSPFDPEQQTPASSFLVPEGQRRSQDQPAAMGAQ